MSETVDDLSAEEVRALQLAAERSAAYRPVKRLLDVVISLFLLVAFAPLVFLAVLLIRLESPGPVLYRSVRFGFQGKPFFILKLRSMTVARASDDASFKHDVAASGYLPKTASDARITRAGKWARRLSIDELPQLINILLGDMSLVGPRPVMPEMLAKYPHFRQARELVQPGLSGPWQVRERSNSTHVRFMWQHDLEYLRKRSLSFDLGILARTVLAVLGARGAR